MPASSSALAITLAPRSWPSRPGLATTTRIGCWSRVVDAIHLPRRLGADEAEPHVAAHRLGVALARIAVAARARQLERHHVAVLEVDRGLAADLALALGAGVDDRPPDLARLA